jgi:hypothetical protein
VSVNWTKILGFGDPGGTYTSTGLAEKELIGAEELADVELLIKVAFAKVHDCPVQEIFVTLNVLLVWDPKIFADALGIEGIGVTAKLSAGGVLSPAM